MRLPALILIATLGCAGCQEAPKAATASADGEILPASISDAMLPLDSVRSQAPLAPKVVASESDSGGAAKPAGTPVRRDRPAPVATAPEPAEAPAAAPEPTE